jgi:hypothetical protein
MPKIKLHATTPDGAQLLGAFLIDPDSIETIESLDLHGPGVGSIVTMKAVTHGYPIDHDALSKDYDPVYLGQHQYYVKESVEEIEALLGPAKPTTELPVTPVFGAVTFSNPDALKRVEFIITKVNGSREDALIKAFDALDEALERRY